MARKIYEMLDKKLREAFAKENTLNEDIKIRRTPPQNRGYYIIMTSDKGDSGESAGMGFKLNMTDKTKHNWNKPFKIPTYFKDFKTGKFGWGYYIPTDMPHETALEYLENLKTLVRDYNIAKKLDVDAETNELTFNQIQLLNDIVEALDNAIAKTENPVANANLEKYFIELENAVESDEVFDFLIKTYEQAKGFQQRNVAWTYSILNSLIITKCDPSATLSGPDVYWSGRNYRIKEEFKEKPIIISMPIKEGGERRKDDMKNKALWIKNHPEDFAAFKKSMGISPATTFDDYVKQNGFYQLAKYATLHIQNFKQKSFKRFEDASTYTDNMVEPIPGKEVEPIGGDVQIPEKGIMGAEQEEKLAKLFDAVISIAQKANVSTLSINKDKNSIDDFNKILKAITLDRVSKKLDYKIKKDRTQQAELLEMFRAYSEMVAHIVKRHYGLPSESSKYNAAKFGGDKENLRKESGMLINMADALINEIDVLISTGQGLNEVRRIIRNIMLENFRK